ncbi:hypothetical protein E0493_06955 [Roseomonas sp. M0104]|uniref:Carrier domain-containing protein n=1 Tax=Teichococcus coralli TaxID=2545983 RepID=A0A845BCQ4_9PROT|nr:phosphopantetheine-binding protein [Pseudoroseomonas coralli]MXP63092.1 hypothetical protein [Pseudoroseomonas coralli]
MINVQQNIAALASSEDVVLNALRVAVMRKLGSAGRRAPAIEDSSNLLEVGVVDSQGLLDLILEVEEVCGLMFDPGRINFEDGVTLRALALAFA